MLDLYRVDRDIASAAAALGEAKEALRRQGEAPDPLTNRRRVSTRSAWQEVGEVSHPIAAAAREWIGWLTLERVLWRDTAAIAGEWRAPRIEAEPLLERPIGARAARAEILTELDPGRRRAWGAALAQHAGQLADSVRRRGERRVEAARLLDIAFVQALELPADPLDAIARSAEQLLNRTDAMVERSDDWTLALSAALGRDASEGWPARLTPRWIAEAFRGTGLTDGLAPDLGPLPAPLGAASFVRALGRFGAALADADVPSSTSFVLWRAPMDLRRERRAALFASLAADAAFGRRVLGLGTPTAREQSRRLARVLVAAVRLDAARVLLREATTLPLVEQHAQGEAWTERALGAAIPGTLTGVVPQLSPADAARFAGVLLAAADRRRLIERYDEDWFKNPEGARAIREEHATPPPRRTTAEELTAGLDELVAALEAAL